MANLTGFDASSIAPREDFSPLPTDEYRLQITDSDMKPTKKNDGQYLEFTYEVLDGQYKGRKLWSRHNLSNPNPKTVEIAERELSTICHAVGVLQPKDSQQLHYKPMLARVELVPADGIRQQRDGNEIRAWKAAPAGAVGNAPATSASPTTTSPSKAPWGQKAA